LYDTELSLVNKTPREQESSFSIVQKSLSLSLSLVNKVPLVQKRRTKAQQRTEAPLSLSLSSSNIIGSMTFRLVSSNDTVNPKFHYRAEELDASIC
jgi:hypothetical protein